MRLVYQELNFSMEIKKGMITSLVLENPAVFESFLINLYQQLSKEKSCFILYDEENEKDLSRNCALITTPLDLNYEKKEIQKNLFAELEENIVEKELINDLGEAHGKILEIFDTMRFISSYEIEYKEDFDISYLLKNYNIHIGSPKGTFAEKLIEYINNLKNLLGKDLFFVINCDAYLKREDYFYIEQCAAYNDICILFVRDEQIELIKAKKEYIIDEDLCEIQ